MTKLCPQNRHKFAILILWVPASAISIPRNISITAVNMAAVTNNTSQIKIPPRTLFTDRAQHYKHVKSQEYGVEINDIFFVIFAKISK